MKITCKRINPVIIALLISGLLFNTASYGNDGPAGGVTLVLGPGQYPDAIKKYNPSKVYLLYWGNLFRKYEGIFLHGDTIPNLKKFTDSAGRDITGFRLIYESNGHIDSVWQVDTKYRITDKAYNLDNDLLRILSFDSTMKKIDEFVFNYGQKFSENTTRGRSDGHEIPLLEQLLRRYEVYTSYDRNNYAVSSVWILSVGIDDYGPEKYQTCKTDAQSYVDFFKKQFTGVRLSTVSGSLFHEYVLLDKDATKEAILSALKDIARKAAFNDYFIFNFSGCSNEIKNDPVNGGTNFFPYDVVVIKQTADHADLKNRNSKDTSNAYKNCIPLKILQEYIQLIPANNQLFISEAGPSGKFKTEFIKTLLQNSPEVASILNKNRIIIVPNGSGLDGVICQGTSIKKGPINYYITSLDSSYNIYDLFKEGSNAVKTAFSIKAKEFTCKSFSYNYFDIFFEKQFLKEYKEIFGDGENQTRGIKGKSKEMQETVSSLTGKHYALVVGTDNYKAKDWKKLNNPIKDAQAVADELANSYGFEVQLLADKPMDTIYKALREYYSKAQPNDQLVVYFAGHGDADYDLLDDGFIVCSDSKSVDEDPMRNTYIPYIKLQKILNNIPARQILVLLDVCHGGTFDATAFSKKGSDKKDGDYNITNPNILQLLKDKLPLRTRKMLSSVGAEAAFDGQAGRHSPFAYYLLQILAAKGGSSGIVTLTNINAVLNSVSMSENVVLKMSPHTADFGTVDAFTEFIFIPVEKATAKE